MKLSTTLLFSISLMLSACYYNNFTEIHPGNDLNTVCDTAPDHISFSQTIQPILKEQCGSSNSCHNGSSSVPLNSYSADTTIAKSGILIDAINHKGSASPMPKGSSSVIARCYRAQIELWVKANCPNN